MEGKRSSAVKINAAERRVQALQWRKKGFSYRAIAGNLKISEAQVRKDIRRSLEELAITEHMEADSLRQLELGRLDDMLAGLSTDIYPVIRDGKVTTPASLPAIAQALKIIQERAKLLGLYAPTQVEVKDWRDHALELIGRGEISYRNAVEEFGLDLAQELFARVGKTIVDVGAGGTREDS